VKAAYVRQLIQAGLVVLVVLVEPEVVQTVVEILREETLPEVETGVLETAQEAATELEMARVLELVQAPETVEVTETAMVMAMVTEKAKAKVPELVC
jgi:hypothetical protein